jgi:cyanophycinase
LISNYEKLTRCALTGWIALFLMSWLCAQGRQETTPKRFRSFMTGNQADVQRPTKPGFVLMGGGTDVDEAFRWLIERSGGGDIVVIRASGADGYNPYIYKLGTVDSVETLLLENREASSDPYVLERIRNAEALWIAGGDQSRYVQYWKNSPVADAIHELARRGVPIGGTSAGLAVLGEFSYAALKDSVTSAEALKNPYDEKVTLEKDFLKFAPLSGIITDSHWVTRDRLGRTLAFLARIQKDGWSRTPRAIAINERTAVLLEPDGAARVVGSSAAYFLRLSESPEMCEAGKPLTLHNVSVVRVSAGEHFDLKAWTSPEGFVYTLNVIEGTVRSSQLNGSLY